MSPAAHIATPLCRSSKPSGNVEQHDGGTKRHDKKKVDRCVESGKPVENQLMPIQRRLA
jgi:hypothetical protein